MHEDRSILTGPFCLENKLCGLGYRGIGDGKGGDEVPFPRADATLSGIPAVAACGHSLQGDARYVEEPLLLWCYCVVNLLKDGCESSRSINSTPFLMAASRSEEEREDTTLT
jgi:hypothetical protein